LNGRGHQHRHRGPTAPRAFAGAVIASSFGSIWWPFSGRLPGTLGACWRVRHPLRGRPDHPRCRPQRLRVGTDGYLYDSTGALPEPPELAEHLQLDQDPGARRHTDHRPILFDSTIFLYITYVMVALVTSACSRPVGGSRPGVGEHPTAADTVGSGSLHEVPQRDPRRLVAGSAAPPHDRSSGRSARTSPPDRLHRPCGDDLRRWTPSGRPVPHCCSGSRWRRERARHDRCADPLDFLLMLPTSRPSSRCRFVGKSRRRRPTATVREVVTAG